MAAAAVHQGPLQDQNESADDRDESYTDQRPWSAVWESRLKDDDLNLTDDLQNHDNMAGFGEIAQSSPLEPSKQPTFQASLLKRPDVLQAHELGSAFSFGHAPKPVQKTASSKEAGSVLPPERNETISQSKAWANHTDVSKVPASAVLPHPVPTLPTPCQHILATPQSSSEEPVQPQYQAKVDMTPAEPDKQQDPRESGPQLASSETRNDLEQQHLIVSSQLKAFGRTQPYNTDYDPSPHVHESSCGSMPPPPPGLRKPTSAERKVRAARARITLSEIAACRKPAPAESCSSMGSQIPTESPGSDDICNISEVSERALQEPHEFDMRSQPRGRSRTPRKPPQEIVHQLTAPARISKGKPGSAQAARRRVQQLPSPPNPHEQPPLNLAALRLRCESFEKHQVWKFAKETEQVAEVLNQELNSSQRQNRDLQAEIKDLRARTAKDSASSKKQKELVAKFTRLQNLIAELSTDHASIITDITQSKKELENLKAAGVDIRACLSDTKKAFADSNSVKESAVETLRQHNAGLEIRLRERDVTLKRLEAYITPNHSLQKVFQSELAPIHNSVQQLRELFVGYKTDFDQSLKTFERTSHSKDDLFAQYNTDSVTQMSNLSSALDNIATSVNAAKEAESPPDYGPQFIELDTSLKKLCTLTEHLPDQLVTPSSVKQAECAINAVLAAVQAISQGLPTQQMLTADNTKLKEEIATLREKLEQTTSALQISEDDCNRLHAESQAASTPNPDIQNEIERLKDAERKLESEISVLRAKIESDQRNHDSEKRSLNSAAEQLRIALDHEIQIRRDSAQVRHDQCQAMELQPPGPDPDGKAIQAMRQAIQAERLEMRRLCGQKVNNANVELSEKRQKLAKLQEAAETASAKLTMCNSDLEQARQEISSLKAEIAGEPERRTAIVEQAEADTEARLVQKLAKLLPKSSRGESFDGIVQLLSRMLEESGANHTGITQALNGSGVESNTGESQAMQELQLHPRTNNQSALDQLCPERQHGETRGLQQLNLNDPEIQDADLLACDEGSHAGAHGFAERQSQNDEQGQFEAAVKKPTRSITTPQGLNGTHAPVSLEVLRNSDSPIRDTTDLFPKGSRPPSNHGARRSNHIQSSDPAEVQRTMNALKNIPRREVTTPVRKADPHAHATKGRQKQRSKTVNKAGGNRNSSQRRATPCRTTQLQHDSEADGQLTASQRRRALVPNDDESELTELTSENEEWHGAPSSSKLHDTKLTGSLKRSSTSAKSGPFKIVKKSGAAKFRLGNREMQRLGPSIPSPGPTPRGTVKKATRKNSSSTKYAEFFTSILTSEKIHDN